MRFEDRSVRRADLAICLKRNPSCLAIQGIIYSQLQIYNSETPMEQHQLKLCRNKVKLEQRVVHPFSALSIDVHAKARI